MAKKSTAARQSNAARRPQTTAKATGVTLVRTPKESETRSTGMDAATQSAAESQVTGAAVAEKPRTVAPSAPARPRPLEAPKAVASKAGAPKPAPEPAQSKARPANEQAARVARARATQRARTANMITPEHYSYVLNDLKVIAGLAIAMFVVIIVLHFVLV